jgi:hypothetical protein
MSEHYGDLDVYGKITINGDISGGYSLPTATTQEGDVVGVTPEGEVEFINLNESPYNYAKLSDIVEASGAPTYFQQLNDTPADFSDAQDLSVRVNASETDLEFVVPNSIWDRVEQTGHGFDVGDSLYVTSGGAYALALASTSNPEMAESVGMVSQVVDANTFDITFEGHIGGLSGLTSGGVYFLSPLIPGKKTLTKPNGLSIAKPMMVALNETEGIVVNYVGYVSLANATDAARYFVPNAKTITGDYTLQQNNYFLRVDTSGGDVTVTLPLSLLNENRIYKIKKISNANKLFVVTTSGDTLLADSISTSLELNDLDAAEFIADGSTNWDVL